MVESAAVRDISEASIYPGVWLHRIYHMYMYTDYACRVRRPEAVHQNRILCLLRHPLAWCVYSNPYPPDQELINVYSSVVRVRSREGRRNRAPPPRVRWKDGKKVNPAVVAAEEAKAKAAAAGTA